MAKLKAKKGFTLVELLIAVAIFAVFLTSITTLIVDIYRASRRVGLEEQIYQDVRIMTGQISKYFENNTIDYEEYYRQAVGSQYFTKESVLGTYSYGDYSKSFYDFGEDGPGTKGEGAYCQGWELLAPPLRQTPQQDPTCVVDKTTIDKNTGRNPINDLIGTVDKANAFCKFGDPCPANINEQTRLFLINEKGDKKTILSLEPITKEIDGTTYNENALSVFWFNGLDTDSDDVPEEWTVGPEFKVDTDPLAVDASLVDDVDPLQPKDISLVYDNFMPISPLRTDIVDLKFYVSPLEDPYKAFAESGSTVIQPHITMVLTVKPSVSELDKYIGPVPQQTIQTTIYSKIKTGVRTY